MRALIYCRVSLDPRAQGHSVSQQEAECRAWAKREGWTVERVIKETGSASRYARSTQARTKWPEVIEALESRDFDVLLTWEASRATRDLKVYAELRDLCFKLQVPWGYSGTVYDMASRDARFRTGLDALLAEDESGRISERIGRSVRARALAGQPHGKIPYGYRREYDTSSGALLRQVPNEETAPVVREIFDRIAGGQGLYTIAKDLTVRGVTPPRPPRTPRRLGDQEWIASTVMRLATNPTMVGLRTHKGVVIGEATWEALVSRELFDDVASILADPKRKTRVGDSRPKYLLSGIAVCGLCGGPMKILNNRGRKAYTCLWCMKVTRIIDPVDRHVTERVIALLGEYAADLTLDDASGNEPLTAAITELEALRRRLNAFTDSAADGELTPGALARIEARMRPQIRAKELHVRRLATPTALARFDLTDPEALWEAADINVRRDLVRAAVTVTILPVGRGKRIWDPTKVLVKPAW